MRSVLFLAILAISLLYSSEPSAFGAGDLDSKTPYGLTNSEKHLLKTSEKVNNINTNVNTISGKTGILEEKIDGVMSILEDISARTFDLENKIQLTDQVHIDDISNIKSDIEKIKLQIEDIRVVQKNNNEAVKKALVNMNSILEKINSEYVSKKDLTLYKNSSDVNKKQDVSQIKDKYEKKDSATILKESEQFINKKEYLKAKDGLEVLIARKYKPARSSFYLGEIYYFTGSYSEAIAFYKNSAQLYDKADYMSTLLYHTGSSFEKLGDKKNADIFFELLKAEYPESKEAKDILSAKKNVK